MCNQCTGHKKVILEDDDAGSSHVLVAGVAPDAAQSVTSPLEDVEKEEQLNVRGGGHYCSALG